ncbi:hypothetical protein TNCV_1503731 [Trichonephila clavipes]|uniref:Uncharacterized protein n=1 Tax=Trichonephila clavipes TaxID=2585209 RepID=A0A8X6RTI6_TRICX|nr:hypothetical protein TNCV_1503731 [Trichonephila clavipes]
MCDERKGRLKSKVKNPTTKKCEATENGRHPFEPTSNSKDDTATSTPRHRFEYQAIIQTLTGGENSAQTTRSCNENAETVKSIQEPYLTTNMTELENNNGNDNNKHDQVNGRDTALWPSIINDMLSVLC